MTSLGPRCPKMSPRNVHHVSPTFGCPSNLQKPFSLLQRGWVSTVSFSARPKPVFARSPRSPSQNPVPSGLWQLYLPLRRTQRSCKMGFPPDALPSTSLPLEGINFLEKKKKSLPVSSAVLAHPVAGLVLVGCSSVPPDLGMGKEGRGSRRGEESRSPAAALKSSPSCHLLPPCELCH